MPGGRFGCGGHTGLDLAAMAREYESGTDENRRSERVAGERQVITPLRTFESRGAIVGKGRRPAIENGLPDSPIGRVAGWQGTQKSWKTD